MFDVFCDVDETCDGACVFTINQRTPCGDFCTQPTVTVPIQLDGRRRARIVSALGGATFKLMCRRGTRHACPAAP